MSGVAEVMLFMENKDHLPELTYQEIEDYLKPQPWYRFCVGVVGKVLITVIGL